MPQKINPETLQLVKVYETVSEAMKENPELTDNFENALFLGTSNMSISKFEWLSHGKISNLIRQKTISDFF